MRPDLFDTILLLAEDGDGVVLRQRLLDDNPALDIKIMPTLAALDTIDRPLAARSRLIAFLFPHIVPADVLSRLGFGAYNFHPGPPDYPGWAPVAFAVYRQASQFGATLHHMAAKPDTGSIIDVDSFTVETSLDHGELAALTFAASLRLFWRHAARLATPGPLNANAELQWTGTPTRRRDVAHLSRLTPALSGDEIIRRKRAFGDGDGFSPPA